MNRQPTDDPKDLGEAYELLVEAAARLRTAWNAEPHGDADAEVEHAEELVAHAARVLVRYVELLPRSDRPVGWNAKPEEGLIPVRLGADDLEALIGGAPNRELKRRLASELGGAFDRWMNP